LKTSETATALEGSRPSNSDAGEWYMTYYEYITTSCQT
jgi:hypothetical protein